MSKNGKDDFVLYTIVASFIFDNIVNAVAPIPLFVASIPFFFAFIFFSLAKKSDRLTLILATSVFLVSYLVNSFRFEFSMQDTSDVLFMILFFSVFLFSRTAVISERCISVITVVLFALFLPAFFGFNAVASNDDVFSSGSSDIEFLRLYNQGYYRLPHVAAYMLAFGGLWWLRMAIAYKKAAFFVLSVLYFFGTLYTGSRTPFFILLIGVVLSNFRFRAKSVIWIGCCAALFGFIWSFFSQILQLLYGTFFYQYATLFLTISENFSRLSRIIIWKSWWTAMSQFDGLDVLVGRGFANSFAFNQQELGLSIWFHNDFLSAIYTYGIFGFIIYLIPHLYALRAGFTGSKPRLFVVVAIFITVSAFINGFYKYMPVLFLVLLFWPSGASPKQTNGSYERGGITRLHRAARKARS
jgi:hypothetical protein